MKIFFTKLLYFFLIIVFGTVLSSFVFMMSASLTLLVAGESINFFNLDFFVRGILNSLPFVVFVSLSIQVLFGIVHKEKKYLKFISLLFFYLLSFLVIIPVNFELKKKYEEHFINSYEIPLLTSNVFRPTYGGVFFFSRVLDNGNADGIFIDLLGISGEQGAILRFENQPVNPELSDDFADVLIKDSVKLPFFVVAALEVYSTLYGEAYNQWGSGFLSWLKFLSFALLLFSCISFEHVSSWGLINGIVVSMIHFVVIVFNYLFYTDVVLQRINSIWFINLCIAFGFFIFGLLFYLFKERKVSSQRDNVSV